MPRKKLGEMRPEGECMPGIKKIYNMKEKRNVFRGKYFKNDLILFVSHDRMRKVCVSL